MERPVDRLRQQQRCLHAAGEVHQATVERNVAPQQRPDDRQCCSMIGWLPCFAKQTIYNQIANGEFKVTTYVDGGQRWRDYRDLAAFLDECRDRAETPA